MAYALLNLSYFPQVIKLVKTKSSKDISVPFLIMLGTGLFLSEIYFFAIQEWILFIGNAVGLILNDTGLILAIKYGRENEQRSKG